MLKIIKTAAIAALSAASAIALLGCGPVKTAQPSPLRTFINAPAEETTPVQSTDATSSATIAPTQAPSPTVDATSGATVTAPAGEQADAVSSATVKGGEHEEDDD